MVAKLSLPPQLEDKIFEIKFNPDDTVSEITSYFPLTALEIKEILLILQTESFNGFRSIFTDNVTAEEWENTKDQIKMKFKNELFDIDDMS
ncbi:MAG: hypothetical protein OEX98_04305 [Nitrosopumilus sp.]|nr:hypothetical protein [Nitrosopumilus sp.]